MEHIGVGKELVRPKQLYEEATDDSDGVSSAARLLLASLQVQPIILAAFLCALQFVPWTLCTILEKLLW